MSERKTWENKITEKTLLKAKTLLLGLHPGRQMRMQKTKSELNIWSERVGEGFGTGSGRC